MSLLVGQKGWKFAGTLAVTVATSIAVNRFTQVNKSDNESDRILWDPTIRRKSYRNPGDDPRDGSVVLDPIGSPSKIR